MSFTQTTIPTIKIGRYENGIINNIIGFNDTSVGNNGCNILSFNFSKSINNISGDFSVTIKDNEDGDFIDLIQPLDIVIISEGNKNCVDFYGIVKRVSFNSTAANFQRQIVISGKSIEHLFEFLNIAEDVTAMSISDNNLSNIVQNLYTKLALKNEDGTYTGLNILDAAKEVYKAFCDVANNKASSITNTEIIELINSLYENNIFTTNDNNLKFLYPITNNMFGNNANVTIVNYMKQLLPGNAYEMYGYIDKEKHPKIQIREVPFDKKSWESLKLKDVVKSDVLINYTLTKSIEEVYTAFFSYVQGSSFSSEWYMRTNASSSNSPTNCINEEKRKKYGFKLLKTNFIGYTNSKESLEDVFLALNTKMMNYYSHLDEMYDATITIINDVSLTYEEKAHIGDRLKFVGGEFYITGEEHSWNYGKSCQITYHCERGGVYDPNQDWNSNFFRPIPKISRRLVEINR